MKILWLTNTPSRYMLEKGGYNGGGWISSLELELAKCNKIKLGVCFVMDNQPAVVERDEITYFPISKYKTKLNKWISYFFHSDKKHNFLLQRILDIINVFKPDIIHVFGTEQPFGLIARETDIPVIIHVQGLLGPCFNAFLPPGFNINDFLYASYNPLKIYKNYLLYNEFFKRGAKRELDILKCCKHYIGRTEWDRNFIESYSQGSNYKLCNEILRPIFYTAEPRTVSPLKLTICSTISGVPFKGFDMILKCAKLLKEQVNIDFEWNVFGNIDAKQYERSFNIKSSVYNINILGVVDANNLVKYISNSTCFVHPSYIDNSPNSVCEAQMLGCPVIAQNVGGLSSLITHGITGFLVPANDPFYMVNYIIKLYKDSTLNQQIGKEARKVAEMRHDKKIIIDSLIDIYNDLIS